MLDENVLRESILDVTLRGWKISSGTYVDTSISCCCPLGAVCVAKGLDHQDGDRVEQAIEEEIGWGRNEMFSFISGFDGCRTYVGMYPDTFNLGQKFRKEYLNK